jgi:hypothetical protein
MVAISYLAGCEKEGSFLIDLEPLPVTIEPIIIIYDIVLIKAKEKRHAHL